MEVIQQKQSKTLNKKNTKVILASTMLAFGILAAAIYYSQPLPSEPMSAYRRMVEAMRKKDEGDIRIISTRDMMSKLTAYQGSGASQLYVYDYLSQNGINPKLLKEPWGIWKFWAMRVNYKKVRIIPGRRAGEVAVFSGEPDYLTFYFEQRSNGWLLSDMMTAAGANLKEE